VCAWPGEASHARSLAGLLDQWRPGLPIPSAEVDGEHIEGRSLCGMLWNCSDILPRTDCDAFDVTWGRPTRKLPACSSR